jgi:hypothetical protein
MRWAKSYSIVDHQLLHGGYFSKLHHRSLALYLFLIVVSDRHGKSYYKEQTIMCIVDLSASELQQAIKELVDEKLLKYNRPYFIVTNFSKNDYSKSTRPIQREKSSHKAELQSSKDFFCQLAKRIQNQSQSRK